MEEIISGKNPVLEAIRSGRGINKIWIADKAQPSQTKAVFELAKQQGIIIQTVDKRKLDQMTDNANHQGVVASVAAHEYAELDDILQRIAEKGEVPFLVLLDEIEDPHNLGSILRSADCTGVHGVVIPKRRAVGLTATVAKTSAGAIEYVPVARVSNMAQTMEQLKKQGIWITGTDASGDQTIGEIDYRVPTALVIGSEGKGMGRLVREKCDFVARIPMAGHVNSLNASVAAALVMFEVFKQRQG